MKVSQIAQGDSTCLSPTERVINRGYRYFYINDIHEETCWNPNYQPLKINPDFYKCLHGLADTEYISEFMNIESSLKAWIPLDEGLEIWTLKLKNNAAFKKTLKTYSVFSFESGGMGAKCDYDWNEKLLVSHIHPYYIRYDEKKDCESVKSYLFMFSDREITSFESDETRFWGCDDLTELPAAVANGCCSNTLSEGQRSIGAFEHTIELAPNEEKEINIVVGCAKSREEAVAIKNRLNKTEDIAKKYSDLEKYWCNVSDNITINTPDENLNYFTNYWLKKQLIAMTVCHRLCRDNA